MLCGDLNGKEIKKGDICICLADPVCYTIENSSIVKQIYSKKN